MNVTPDSFSDGGAYLDPKNAVVRATEMISEGADIIDIGAVSTKPGAVIVSSDEEMRRLAPVLEAVITKIDAQSLSIDASSFEAIELGLAYNVGYLNLCGGLPEDGGDWQRIAESRTRVIIYPNHTSCGSGGVVAARMAFFAQQIQRALGVGISPGRFILDPGVGFGQSYEQCLETIGQFEVFTRLGCETAIGVSRKKHLARLFGQDPQEMVFTDRVEASLAAAAIAVHAGATYVRTHDVAQTKRFFKAYDALLTIK